MNVHLLQPRTRGLLFAFLLSIAAGVPVLAQSGAYKNLITSKNTAVNDTIAGVNLAVSKVNPLAQHGDVYITIIQSGGSGNPYIYKISYVPDPGFIGVVGENGMHEGAREKRVAGVVFGFELSTGLSCL